MSAEDKRLNLLPQHLEDLRGSGLSDWTIAQWGCYSITTDQRWVMTQLGFGHVEPPLLALPILPPGRKEPDLNDVIVKPDRPRKDSNGKPIKYEMRPRSQNHLHVPLSCRDRLGDPSVSLWITEGQKKAEKAAQEGLCCIALPGVWSWLVRVASEVSFPVGDFSLIELSRLALIAFDSDAIRNASVKLASRRLGEFLIKRGAKAYRVWLPDEEGKQKVGLDDYLCVHSVKELQALAREQIPAKPDIGTLLGELSPESDSAQIESLLKLIAQEESAIEAERIVKKVATRTKLRVSLLREQLEGFGARSCPDNSQAPVEMSEAERAVALALLQSPDLLKQFITDTERLGCVGQKAEKTELKLACASGRMSDTPINTTVKGESSGGKNFLLHSVLETEPPEDVIEITGMSAKALQYLPTSLTHKLVAITEVAGSEDADYSLRTFQSERVIRIWVVEKDATGHLETREHEVQGPAGFFQTTTKAHLHPENETRTFDVFIDESEEQTERIFEAQNNAHVSPMGPGEREAVLRRWRNAGRLLTPMPVLIPFAGNIKFPTKPLRVRRDRPRVLALIEASALLHQHQRKRVEKNGRAYLLATVDDYDLARELAIALLESALSGATPKCRRLVEWAEKLAEGQCERKHFSKVKVDLGFGWSRKTTLKYLREAVSLGCLAMDRDRVEKSAEFWFVKKVESPLVELPRPEEIIELPAEVGTLE